MKTIAFEEHFITQEFIDAIRSTVGFSTSANTDVLLDMGAGRLKVMDEAGIDMQVLSLFQPGVQALDVPVGVAILKINDKLAEVVKKYPKRFAGLGRNRTSGPEEAAKETREGCKEAWVERDQHKLSRKGDISIIGSSGLYLPPQRSWMSRYTSILSSRLLNY